MMYGFRRKNGLKFDSKIKLLEKVKPQQMSYKNLSEMTWGKQYLHITALHLIIPWHNLQ